MRTIRTAPAPRVENISLSRIKNKFDVRVLLDEDRVLQFAGLYQGGVKLPPVKLVKIDEDEYAYIDGRTRGAARAYLNLPDVPAVVLNGSLRDNPVELFAEALESNWGGAKPPSREDIVHVIQRLLELNVPQKAIRERLHFIPAGAATAYLAQARSTLAKRRLTKALDSISNDGLSLDTAARQYKVKPERLKEVLTGKKGKFGAARTDEQQIINDLKVYISKQLFAAQSGIGKKLVGLFTSLDEGRVSAKSVAVVLKAYQEHNRKIGIRITDWQARLDGIVGERDRAVAVEA